ncbi:class I SAM-dependent methyltransferase [Carnobacterium gallinarum]|uniref:class I SAM-dependent methyltransferase n=1 Tax=Carnobacterium gallinarum TaxID=2749 RepID=UPI000552D993|nr:class I SAM-dependent methyltransferase [Carnobacterium gallinarum]
MGREFLEVFSDWAEEYDTFVQGQDPAYQPVFKDYSVILKTIVEKSGNSVIEFGIGTGNLTLLLLESGRKVFPIEPSPEMRQLASLKLPHSVTIYDGDLQHYPLPTEPVDTIVSSYVFHHLTDAEKLVALKDYATLLPKSGKLIFADTMFQTQESYDEKIQQAYTANFIDLAEDLEREYYPLITTMENSFKEAGFSAIFTPMNDYVWLVEATKL